MAAAKPLDVAGATRAVTEANSVIDGPCGRPGGRRGDAAQRRRRTGGGRKRFAQGAHAVADGGGGPRPVAGRAPGSAGTGCTSRDSVSVPATYPPTAAQAAQTAEPTVMRRSPISRPAAAALARRSPTRRWALAATAAGQVASMGNH